MPMKSPYARDPRIELELILLGIQERSLRYWNERGMKQGMIPPFEKSKPKGDSREAADRLAA